MKQAMSHPVQLHIERPSRTSRIHVVTRLLLLLAVGALGCSSLYGALYLALPAAAMLLVVRDGADRYLAEDASRIVRVLRWFASAYGYLWLLTDALPTTQGGPVDLQITPGGRPTPGSALLRVITTIPAAVLLALLGAVAGLAWIVGAMSILLTEQMPAVVADFLALTLRVQFRLVAYHLSLVDRYPSLEGKRSDEGLKHVAA
jgi:hypothetical protein